MSQYNSIPISQLIPGSQVLATDVFPATDVTDLSQSSSGTTKKYTILQMQEYLLNEFNGDNLRSALYATTGNLVSNYTNGTAGVGARLVNAGALATLVVDGNIVLAGDRILVPYQSSSFQNGVYQVIDAGDVGTPWVLERVTDFDGSILGEILTGMFIYVVFGSANALTCWLVTSQSFPTVGTTPIVFQKQTNPIMEAWTTSGVNTQMVVNTGYTVTANATFTLPVLASPGEWIELNGANGLFTIAQNAGQVISFAGYPDTTVGVGGSISTPLFHSCIKIRCNNANTSWVVVSSVGLFTII